MFRIVLFFMASTFSTLSNAEDQRVQFSIKKALESKDAQEKINKDIKLFWGDQSTPAIKETKKIISTNRKTNAVGKSNEEACNWVLLSAIIALQEKAKENGANAIVKIRSNFKNIEFSSPEKFECGVGTIMAGVSLVGNIVVLGDKEAPANQEPAKEKSLEDKCKEKGGKLQNGNCVLEIK